MNPAPTIAAQSPGPVASPLDLALHHLTRILIRRQLDADVPWLAVENAERHLAGVIATAGLAANLAGRETTFRTARRAMETGEQYRRPLLSAQFHAAIAATFDADFEKAHPRNDDGTFGNGGGGAAKSPVQTKLGAWRENILKTKKVRPDGAVGGLDGDGALLIVNDDGEIRQTLDKDGKGGLIHKLGSAAEAERELFAAGLRKVGYQRWQVFSKPASQKKADEPKKEERGPLDDMFYDDGGDLGDIENLFSAQGVARFAADPLAPVENNGGLGELGEGNANDGAYDVPPMPTYQQAIDAILRRTPAVARTWQDVAAVMARNGIAFARAATQKIADRIRESLAGTIAVGQGREYAVSLMQLIAPWTRAYSETVYRTNTATAYTDGMMEFASDPSVSDAVAGFRFSATGDSNTRPNHQAADGLTARADDMVWQQLKPPLGYACRCRLIILTVAEAKRRRMLTPRGVLPDATWPNGAYPDPGFRK